MPRPICLRRGVRCHAFLEGSDDDVDGCQFIQTSRSAEAEGSRATGAGVTYRHGYSCFIQDNVYNQGCDTESLDQAVVH